MKISVNIDRQVLLATGALIIFIVAVILVVAFKRGKSSSHTSVVQNTYAYDDIQHIRHPSKCYACERQSTKSYPTKCFDCEKQESQAHWQASYGSPKVFAGL